MAYLVIDKVMSVHTETRCETFKEAIKKLNESIGEYYEVGFGRGSSSVKKVSDVMYKFYNSTLGYIGSVYIKKVQ